MKKKNFYHKAILIFLILPTILECILWYFYQREISAAYSIGMLAFIIYDLTD